MELAGVDSFSLRKIAAAAQNEKHRLIEPLLLYATATGQTERLLGFVYKDDVRRSYENVLTFFEGIELEEAARDRQLEGSIPREYGKFLASFRASYNRPETSKESKRMRWERSRALQLETGISTAEICHALGLNPGNVNAYLKHGDLDKVSLRTATAIMTYLFGHVDCRQY